MPRVVLYKESSGRCVSRFLHLRNEKTIRLPPVWVMGLANATFGLMGGFTVVTLPQMLAADGVSGGKIAEIVAVGTSPTFWAVLLAPMLDVRFRRRTYALALALMTAAAAAITVLYHHRIVVVESVLTAGFAAAALFAGAMGGWTGSLIEKDQDSSLGIWFSVANAGAGSLMIFMGGSIVNRCSPPVVAALVAGLILLPLVFFFFIPAPEPDRTLASESFGRFGREVTALLERREVLIALALFVAPSGSFALTNVLAGVGQAFSASPRTVSLFGGIGTSVAGIGGSFLLKPLARSMPLRPLYLSIGIAGALFTLSLLLMPRAPWTFGLAMVGENIFQALAFATTYAISFEVIGPGNPLAATTFSVLNSAVALPVVYMGYLDGSGYNRGGITGSFLTDAGLGLAACLFLAVVLRRWLWASRRTNGADALPSRH